MDKQLTNEMREKGLRVERAFWISANEAFVVANDKKSMGKICAFFGERLKRAGVRSGIVSIA